MCFNKNGNTHIVFLSLVTFTYFVYTLVIYIQDMQSTKTT